MDLRLMVIFIFLAFLKFYCFPGLNEGIGGELTWIAYGPGNCTDCWRRAGGLVRWGCLYWNWEMGATNPCIVHVLTKF